MDGEISIQQLLREVGGLAGGMDRGELCELLSGLARIQPVEERSAFLSTLQKLAGGKPALGEASDSADRAETLVRYVGELAEEAGERQAHIENGEYHELDDWEEEDYGYRRDGWYHDECPDVFSEDLLDQLRGIRTEADHWFLDGGFKDAATVYRALIELEGDAREEFFGEPGVCDQSTGEKYCLCICRLAREQARASELYDAVLFVAVNLRFPSGFEEQGFVPLKTFRDEGVEWSSFEKICKRESFWVAKRLYAETLAMEKGVEDALGWLRTEGSRQIQAWLWFLHELEIVEQWSLLTECSKKALGFLEEETRRVRVAGLLVKSGAALGNLNDVAEGLRICFYMNPSRRLLAELVGRLEKDTALLRSELEAYDGFLERRSFDQLHAVLKLLLGLFDEVQKRCAERPQHLGWSYSVPDPMAVASGFILLCRGAKALPEQVSCFVERYLWRDCFDCWYESPAEGEAAKWNKALRKRLERTLAETRLGKEEKTELLDWLRKRVAGRADQIVGNQHRKSYGKAAEGLAAWAEAARRNGMPVEAGKLVSEFKERYPRHRAFQKELDQRTGSAA